MTTNEAESSLVILFEVEHINDIHQTVPTDVQILQYTRTLSHKIHQESKMFQPSPGHPLGCITSRISKAHMIYKTHKNFCPSKE